jgi:hypothetical protein
MRGSDRPQAETTAAIRASTPQHDLGAGRTERAFEAAYHHVGRIGRQITITAFTVRAEFEHEDLRDRKSNGVRSHALDNPSHQ